MVWVIGEISCSDEVQVLQNLRGCQHEELRWTSGFFPYTFWTSQNTFSTPALVLHVKSRFIPSVVWEVKVIVSTQQTWAWINVCIGINMYPWQLIHSLSHVSAVKTLRTVDVRLIMLMCHRLMHYCQCKHSSHTVTSKRICAPTHHPHVLIPMLCVCSVP